MITSQGNFKLYEAHQQDKFILTGARENLVADSHGNVYPMGGVPPAAAPTAEVITGGGALTPGIGYSYAATYFNPYQDCETAPSPASAFVGRKDAGEYTTITFSVDGRTVGVVGANLNHAPDYYSGQTLACEIVNDEYVATYSQWQYRVITGYYYDPVNERGMFTINRPFFNVDPDATDQQYRVKIDELETEEGIVGGKTTGKNKIILGATASQNPADYRLKTIHIVQGKGKGQKRVIVDASLREDGLIEATVDSPWKEKPKFVDPEKGDVYKKREEAEAQNGTKRGDKFYKQYYSSEYVISDPLRYNGLAIDANVISSDDKGRRVKLSGLGHTDGLLTGKVVNYTDNAGVNPDVVTVKLSGAAEVDENDASYVNKRFRIFNGAGAGLDVRISAVKVISDERVKLTLDTYGKFAKSQKPNGTSEFVIYAGEMVSSSYINPSTQKTHYPRVIVGQPNDGGDATLYCCAYNTTSKAPDPYGLAAQEAQNVELYNSGRCYITFAIEPWKGDGYGTAYYITRPIKSAEVNEITLADGTTTYQTVIKVSDLPMSYGGNARPVSSDAGDNSDAKNTGAYYVYNDTLQDGYYTGWMAVFYNTQDTFAKGKKKAKTVRVAGYLDATGELLLCNGVPGVGEGWQCTLYSEYTRQIGSRVRVYLEDSTDPAYTTATNTRFFLLDYFASPNTDEYKDWTFEFLYGHAKKVKGKTVYQQDKNKKTYSVFAYDGPRRRVDCAGDENYARGIRMKPAPIGDEFVTIYDPASYIYKVFDSNDSDADDKSEGNDSSGDGIKMRVTGFAQSPLPGFDKIKLYRASESTGTYRLCAILDNRPQTFIDNVPEHELTEELDYAHSAPTPAQYVASRNGRFALAGTAVNPFNAELAADSYIGTQRTTAVPAVEGVEYSAPGFSSALVKNAPLVGIRCAEVSRLNILLHSETVTERLRLQCVIGAAPTDGVICGAEKRVHQSVLDSHVYPYDGAETLTGYREGGGASNEVEYAIPEGFGDWNTGFEIVSINGIPYGQWPEPPYQFQAGYSPARRVITVTCYGSYPHDDMLEWPLVIKKTGDMSVGDSVTVSVSQFYLDKGAGNTDTAYTGAILRIVDASETPTPRFFRFGEDIKYTGSSGLCELQNGKTIKLKLKIADLGTLYEVDDTGVNAENKYCYIYAPAAFSIYQSEWQVYYEGGAPYIWDGEKSTAVTATAIAGGAAVLLDAPLPTMVSDSFISIDFGGEINARRFGGAAGADVYYVAFRRNTGKDPALLSYDLSKLAFVQKWDWERTSGTPETGTGKIFASVPAMESNGALANLYVQHDNNGFPVITQSNLRSFIPGYSLLIFEKPVEESGALRLIVKGANVTVQLTTPGAGLREKVELENLYILDDGHGTMITGIVPLSSGFLVFKDRGVYLIDPEWKLKRNGRPLVCITHEYGCIAPGSIAEARSGIIWMSSGGRLMRQSISLEGATNLISKELQPWFDGDEDLAGTYVNTEKLFSRVQAEYDADYGYYIIAVPAKKRADDTETTVILMFDEGLYQWYRLSDSQSGNSCLKAFRYEGRAAFCGLNGIYDFKPDRTRINAWEYASRWRDDGNNDRFKLIKRLRINNETRSTVTGDPTAQVVFYKEQKDTPEPNLLSWVDGAPEHPFYTNIPKAQVEAGVRCYEWRFVLSGHQFVNIKSIDTELRSKDDKPKALDNTPNEAQW